MKDTVRLRAGCETTLQAPGPTPLIAMLRPRSGEAQWIVSEQYELEPFVRAVEYVDVFGNLCQRMVAPAKGFRIRTEVVVEVAKSIAVLPGGGAHAAGCAAGGGAAVPVAQSLLPLRHSRKARQRCRGRQGAWL